MDSDVTALIWIVQQLQLARYFKVVIFTLFFAEYLHTFTTEVNTLWAAPWTIVKVLFLISRYTPFLDGSIGLTVISLSTPSSRLCTHLLKVQLWSAGIGQPISQILLFYRAYALAGRTRLSAIILTSLAFTMIALDLTFIPIIQRDIQVASPYAPDIFPKCFFGSTDITANRMAVIGPIDTIFLETVLFGVIYWAKVKKYREDRNWLMRKIYRDALLYYLLLLVSAITGVIVYFATTGPIRELSPTMLRYLTSIIASRIILNIRQYANKHRTLNGVSIITGTGVTAPPISGMHFAGSGQGSGIDTDLRLH